MLNVKRCLVLVAPFVGAPGLMAQAPVAKPEKLALTVDTIMRGPDLVGYAPDSLRWSADSQKLYFDWRKPGEDDASTYVVARAGGAPTKRTDDQKKTVPPANGRWDKAWKRVLFADRGDIVMIDATGTRKWITRTIVAEGSPRWAKNDPRRRRGSAAAHRRGAEEDRSASDRQSEVHARGTREAARSCHGMVDTNVLFQDSVRRAQRLIELRKEN